MNDSKKQHQIDLERMGKNGTLRRIGKIKLSSLHILSNFSFALTFLLTLSHHHKPQ
jgi:hypothetical protein